MHLPIPPPTLFPYTTLFRSALFFIHVFVLVLVIVVGVFVVVIAAGIHVMVMEVTGPALQVLEKCVQLGCQLRVNMKVIQDRKSTRLNSSHRCISYAVFCLKK